MPTTSTLPPPADPSGLPPVSSGPSPGEPSAAPSPPNHNPNTNVAAASSSSSSEASRLHRQNSRRSSRSSRRRRPQAVDSYSLNDNNEDDNDDDDSDDSESYSGPEQTEDDSSSSTSSISTPSMRFASSSVAAGAPTPFNTVFDEYAYADVTRPGPEADYISYNDDDEEVARDVAGVHEDKPEDMSVPTLAVTSSRPSVQGDDFIPISTRPVPAPPQLRTTVSNHLSPVQSSSVDSKLGINDGEERKRRFTNRFRRRPITQVDRDTARLQQLGYDAVLGRDYTFWSSFGIAMMNLGFIQGTVSAVPGAYLYGGPAMMLVAWPLSGVLSMALVSTLSELASAYPVAGGMASWAWKCARAGIGGERYWGWVMGAIVLGGHIGNLVLVSWQAVRIITGTMGLAFNYNEERWHMVLFYLALVLVVGSIGSTAFGSSHRYWIAAGIFGFATWLSLVISLLATGVRHRDYSISQPISTAFTTKTGWSSKFYVYILGWQSCTIAAGADVCAHMSEETQNPSRNVPKAMTWSVLVTYVLAYISIIILFLSVPPKDAAFIAGQDFAVGHILERAVSLRGAVAICSIIVVVMCIQLQAQLQAASRFVFAMARDRALPFSDQLKLTNKEKQPFMATFLCIVLWAPFCCLLIGKAAVIRSVATMGAATLSMLGYLIPCALYLVSRLDLQVEGRSAWSLRRFSRPVAAVSALFCLAVVVVQNLPPQHPVTAQNMSWAPVVIVGTLLLSFITWKTYGNVHYSGPIRALTKWETGMEIDLDSTLQASTARGRDSGTTSLKLAVTPCYPETVPTVQVASARTVESDVSMGEWAQASFTTTEGFGTDSVTDASRSRSSRSDSAGSGISHRRRGTTTTMGRVDEEDGEMDVFDPNALDDEHIDVPDTLDVDLERGHDVDEKYDDEDGDTERKSK